MIDMIEYRFDFAQNEASDINIQKSENNIYHDHCYHHHMLSKVRHIMRYTRSQYVIFFLGFSYYPLLFTTKSLYFPTICENVSIKSKLVFYAKCKICLSQFKNVCTIIIYILQFPKCLCILVL